MRYLQPRGPCHYFFSVIPITDLNEMKKMVILEGDIGEKPKYQGAKSNEGSARKGDGYDGAERKEQTSFNYNDFGSS